jgi:hypothetical protein
VEVSACLEHWLSESWAAVLAADLVVLLAAILMTRPGGLPEADAPVSHAAMLAAQVALPVIYLGSVVRTLLRGFAFTGFETVQLALALSLGVGGAACYLLGFRLDSGRNAARYGAFGLLVVLSGTRIARTLQGR